MYLGWGYHTESIHDAVWVLLTDFAYEQCAHTRACASTQGVCELEALEAVTALCLLSHNIQDWVHQFGSLCVVAFSPVITCSTLACVTSKPRNMSHIEKNIYILSKHDFTFLAKSRTYIEYKWLFSLLEHHFTVSSSKMVFTSPH